MKIFQLTLSSILICLFFATSTFAQAETEKEIIIVKKIIDENGVEKEEKIILTGEEAEKYLKDNNVEVNKKVTIKEGVKEMRVEVTTEGEGNEEITVTVDDRGMEESDGDSKVIFIDAEGEEIPDDIREMLLEKGIDIDGLIEGEKGQIEIKETQQYKIVEIDDDGNKKTIEWNGEGEMPEEMKAIMEQEQSLGKMNKKKIIMIEDEDVDLESDGQTKVIKIRKDKNGEVSEEIFELDGDDELPSEVLEILKEHNINHEDINGESPTKIKIEIEEESGGSSRSEMKPNKAQLGVLVDDDEHVRIVDFTNNAAAKEAGMKVDDIIVKLDKTEIKNLESLLKVLSDKKPGDVVKVKVLREGKKKKFKVKLKAIEQGATSSNYRTEHKVLKIEGGDIVKCEPNENVTTREALSENEIEVIEERIIEDTGMKQVNIITGSNSLDIGELDLFPNPTDGTIRVRFQIDNQEVTKVQIIDIAGRALYENTINDFTGTFDELIDLTGKGMGTLVLVIAQGDKAISIKNK